MKPHCLVLAAALAAIAGAAQAGDAAKGAVVFKRCIACHTATEALNKVGPSLQGVVGRPVATAKNFRYSRSMLAFAEGKTWTEADLASFIANPKQMIPGNAMAFFGLKQPEDVADLVAYLKDPAAAQ